MNEIKENKMGTKPIFGLIVSMSVPPIISMLILALYNIVDSIYVAQVSNAALTAVSLAYPIQVVMTGFAVGTAVGLNSLISRRLGEKKNKEASKIAAHGLVLGVIMWVLFAVLGLLLANTFITMFTTDPDISSMGTTYLTIVTVFSTGLFMSISIEKMIVATGNVIVPMISQLAGGISNIILDPIFIFGWFGVPAFGVAGAAIATVLGQFLAMTFCFCFIKFKKHVVDFSLKGFKWDWEIVKNIYKVGFPSIVMQTIASFVTTFLNLILIGFSDVAVSVLGVYYKLQSFVFMPVFGVTTGILPIMGYNFGAKNKKRLMDTLKIGTGIAIGIMALGTVVFMLLPEQLLAMFNADEEMLSIGIPALRTISLCFIPAAYSIVCSTFFQSLGHGMKSLIVSIIRQVVFLIPVAYFLSLIGVNYVWYSFPIAEASSLVVSTILLLYVYKRVVKKIKKSPLSN